jgi:hypothetical protein
MLRSVKYLKGYRIEAKDGDIGEVVEFYFDDETWTVRYLVADTGNWLTGRQVLISPMALGKIDRNSNRLQVNLSRSQVENSPGIDSEKPVSRQHEAEFSTYYGYPYYWAGPYIWGPVPYPVGSAMPAPPTGATTVREEVASAQREQTDVHLRSTKEVTGYYIEASDGDIGHVEDFLIEDDSWKIRYIVVDTKNWWPGKKVVVSPEWIRSVSWTDSKVYVDVPRDAIRNAPEYDTSRPMTRDDEKRLYAHHERPNYWTQ